MKNKVHNKLRIFFYVLYAYLISSIIFPSSDNYGSTADYGFTRLIPQLLSTLVIALSIPCVFKALKSNILSIRTFYIFALVTFVNFLVSLSSNGFSLFFMADQFKIFVWIFPIYYLYGIFNRLEQDKIQPILKMYIFLFYTYLIIAIFQEYAFRTTGSIEILTEGQGVYSGGAIYFLVPLIFTIFDKRAATYLWIIGFGIAILTAKRTPIVLLLIFGIFQLKGMLKSLKARDYAILTVIIFTGVTLLLAQYWEMLVERNANDAQAGGTYGSGREVFYMIVLKGWLESDLFKQIFGHGFGSVHALLLKEYGMAISSHNGFLDCLYVYGLLGLIAYIAIFVSVIRRYDVVKRLIPQYKSVYMSFIGMWISQNLIIHGFSGPNFIPYGIFLAYIESEIYKARKLWIHA